MILSKIDQTEITKKERKRLLVIPVHSLPMNYRYHYRYREVLLDTVGDSISRKRNEEVESRKEILASEGLQLTMFEK